MCDWIDNAIALQMGHSRSGQIYGYLHLPCRVEVNARAYASRASLEKQLG